MLNDLDKAYSYPLYSEVKHLNVRYEDFEEVFSSALMDLWKVREGFMYTGAVYNYLSRTVKGKCIDLHRRSKSGKQLQVVPLDHTDVADESSFFLLKPAQAAGPQLMRQLYEAIQQLPARQRAVLYRFLLQEQSNQDIARALGISESAVRAHKTKAIAALRRKLGPLRQPDDLDQLFRLSLLLALLLFFIFFKKSMHEL